MTTISAKVITDSVSHAKTPRLTTFELIYPRFIHAEFMTHRVFSRNASSSRAIPVSRQIERIIEDPAMPIFWGANKPGMQAGAEHNAPVIVRNRTNAAGFAEQSLHWITMSREEAWLDEMRHAIAKAKAYDRAGYHKQIINRILEPYSHIKVVCTATDWSNFFELRDHADAEPHIQLLAQRMLEAMLASKPQQLSPDEWHLPYVTADDIQGATRYSNSEEAYWGLLRKVSTARCARTSYDNHDGSRSDFQKDVKLHDQLVGATPIHASPAEHQASPDRYMIFLCANDGRWGQPKLHGNLKGWLQYRKLIERELASNQPFRVAG